MLLKRDKFLFFCLKSQSGNPDFACIRIGTARGGNYETRAFDAVSI